MIGEAGRHGWGALVPFPRCAGCGEQAAAVVGPAAGVGGADQPHAGDEGRLGAGDGTTPSGERCEMGTEGGVEPLDVGGIDDGASRRRRQDRLDTVEGVVNDAVRDPDDVALAECLTTWANWKPSGRTSRGRPR